MSKISKNMCYIDLSLIAPEIAQSAIQKWMSGLLQLFGAIACSVWMIVAFALIMIINIYMILNGKEPQVHIIDVFIPMEVIVLLWIYSFIDLFLFCNLKGKKAVELNNYQI